MNLESPSPSSLSDFLQKQWLSKAGLASALIIAIVVAETMLIAAEAVWWLNLVVLCIVLLATSLAWWLSRQPPKTPKGKVGFLVSITCGDDSESKRLREDFLVPLQQLIKSGVSGKAFHFIRLPQHLAGRIIDQEDAEVFRLRARAHFMLYGQVRLRTIGGKEHHVIDLDGIVIHKRVPKDISTLLSKEFTELLPRRVQIDTENDLLSFQFTSEWADIVAKYIIGISAVFSGDLDYAEVLYKDAQTRLRDKDKTFPVYKKLESRIPSRIAEICEARAQAALNSWWIDHDPKFADGLRLNLEKLREQTNDMSLRALHLSAVSSFLSDRDIESAMADLKKVKHKENGLWHYNMAFLECYGENLRNASREYKKAAEYKVVAETIVQVEDFVCWVLQEEPSKYQLHYCLGIFNRHTKGDFEQAKHDFRTFSKNATPDAFMKEQELARKWIAELDAELEERANSNRDSEQSVPLKL